MNPTVRNAILSPPVTSPAELHRRLKRGNYNAVMREWFLRKGALVMTDLSALCDEWYTVTRTGWTGGTTFYQPSQSSISTGARTGDNAGISCTPSTNTLAGVDDYANLPLFAPVDCNVTLDAAGEPHIISIDGITSAVPFARADPAKITCVAQMTGWCKRTDGATTYSYEYTDQSGALGYSPLPEAVKLDGSARTWVVHVKYAMGDDYGSYSGAAPRVWDISHNSQQSAIRSKWGTRYCGKTSADDAFVKWMTYIKYASLTLDGIMNGCLSYYNNALSPAKAETGVQRVLVTPAQGAGLVVGSTVCLGSTTYGSKSTQCSVVDRKKIVSIETVSIDGTTYSAVNINNGGTKFATTTALYLTTMQWHSGSCDSVLGNDGSPYNNTSTKEPYKIQGIEQLVGCYEVMSDTILQYYADGGTYYCKPYVCRDATKQSTAVTSDYRACGYAVTCPAADGWQYIRKLGIDAANPELMFPADIAGGSSSTFTKDAMYVLAVSTSVYEWLSFGLLSNGLAGGGLSYVDAYNGLAYSDWGIGGRLSVTGTRGEWAA